MSHKEKQSDRRKRLKRVQTTRWTNKAEAVKVVVACYEEVISSLDDLQDLTKFDRETVTLASGLKKKLNSFDVAITLRIAQRVFTVMNPVTVTLQGVMTDYGAVRGIIDSVKNKLKNLRSDSAWEETYKTALEFVNKYDVPEPTQRRIKRKKRFMDEVGVDEPILDIKSKLKVETYFKVLDSLLLQLEDRFPDHSLKMVQQMSNFSHSGVLKIQKNEVKPNEIEDLCKYYKWDVDAVTCEVNSFSEIYAVTHINIDMTDVLGQVSGKEAKNSVTEEDGDEEEEEEGEEYHRGDKVKNFWLDHGFLKPYRCLMNFSGFSKLEVVYTTLLTLAVTSCSAERAMSKLKIVKNRLRSCMSDEWLSNLMVLSSERDVLAMISNDEIIDRFSQTTSVRKKLLEK